MTNSSGKDFMIHLYHNYGKAFFVNNYYSEWFNKDSEIATP